LNKTAIQHEFIAIDEGLGNLLCVNERAPKKKWIMPIGRPQPRDMQLIGGNKILLGHHHGYSEFDMATGKIVKEFKSLNGVTAARRQPNGNIIIAGVDIAGAKGVVVLELNANDQEVHRAIFPGDYVRLIRQTNDGTYLMSCNDRIREGSRDGKYIREFPVEGFFHAWKAVRLANGNLIVSAGYGAFLVELNPDGKILRKFGGKESVPEKVRPFFYAMFQLLPNGNTVLANWQGHGLDFGNSGVQLLEFNPAGEIVWSWSNADLISSLQGVLVLDGLNTDLLHDERDGLMKPVLPEVKSK
jgi:outer membrane protein assembly factor BamB